MDKNASYWRIYYSSIIKESKEIHIDELPFLKSLGFEENSDENGNISFKKELDDGSVISIVWDSETMGGIWRGLKMNGAESEKCIDIGSNFKLKNEKFMTKLFEKDFPELNV